MKIRVIFACLWGALALAGCGSPRPSDPTSGADDFAARINGSNAKTAAKTDDEAKAQEQGTSAPTVAQPLQNAAEGAFAPGTATDPASATCGANEMGQFIGLEADDNVQLAIINVIDGANEVRFVQPGSDFIRPDATNPRLNIMLDQAGIVRDARCG